MSLPILFSDGARGAIVAIDGERVSLTSDRAFAPGARFEGACEGLSLRFKAHRSVRSSDDRFEVEARFVDLTRKAREALVAALSGD